MKKTPGTANRRPAYLPLKQAYGEVPVYERYSLKEGTVLEGPLVLEERECTIVSAVKSRVTILPDLTVSIAIEAFD